MQTESPVDKTPTVMLDPAESVARFRTHFVEHPALLLHPRVSTGGGGRLVRTGNGFSSLIFFLFWTAWPFFLQETRVGQGFRAAGGHATEGSRVDACVGHLYDQNFAHTHITLHRCRLEGVNRVRSVNLASQELTQKAMRKQR